MASDPVVKQRIVERMQLLYPATSKSTTLGVKFGHFVEASDAAELHDKLGVGCTLTKFRRALGSLMYRYQMVGRYHARDDGRRYYFVSP